MPTNISYLAFRSLARVFGSIFFPLFNSWGENDHLAGSCKVVFARDHGFVSILNLLRFFKTPVSFIISQSAGQKLIWRALKHGGLKVCEIPDDASEEKLTALIIELSEAKDVPVFLLDSINSQRDNNLINCFKDSELLYFAESGCERTLSLGFIPVVNDIKAICSTVPAYSEKEKEYFRGIKTLDFLESALSKTPLFELPTFFFTHSKFSAENLDFEKKITKY